MTNLGSVCRSDPDMDDDMRTCMKEARALARFDAELSWMGAPIHHGAAGELHSVENEGL